MGKKLKGKNFWEELEGKKEELTKTIEIEFADVTGEIEVEFVDIDEVQDIIELYQEKKSKKPVISVPSANGKKNIKIPTDKPQYEKFNTHEDAKKWQEKNKIYDTLRNCHLAYRFITEEDRPECKNAEEGAKILKERLGLANIIEIVNAGNELNGFANRSEQARKNS